MSLLIRRGLDVDRMTITPSEGELIYTTDTKALYIGDGVTVGGNSISTGGIETDPIYSASSWFSTTNNSTDWDTAYSWGDHSLAGYLTSYSETDPIYSASSWFSTTNNASNWNAAFGWGNHASAGYLTTISGLNISLLTNDSGYITSSALSPYLTSATAASTYQPLDADLTSIAALGFSSTAFLKKTAANTWTLDTNTYLTSISGLNISLLTNDSGYITSSALSPYLTSATAASTYFPLIGGSLTGTAGAGFFGAIAQSSNPSAPTSGFRLFANSSHAFSWIGQNGYIRTFDGTSNTADRTYTLPNSSGTISLGTGTTNELTYWNGTNTIGSLTTSTYPSLTELSYVKGVTSAIQTQITSATTGDLLNAFSLLGSSFKSISLNVHSPSHIVTGGALADQSLRFVAVYLPVAQTITGVKFFQHTQGNYTANNYNGVGLYSYSGGTLTLVASSTNDGNIWKGTTSTWQTKAFSSTYVASAGIYFIGALYCTSSQTTAPQIGSGTSMTNSAVSAMDFTNSAKLVSSLSSQTTLPSSQAMSGTTNSNINYGFWLY